MAPVPLSTLDARHSRLKVDVVPQAKMIAVSLEIFAEGFEGYVVALRRRETEVGKGGELLAWEWKGSVEPLNSGRGGDAASAAKEE